MTNGTRAVMDATLDELAATDPDGVARVEAAYASVGLGFWPGSSWAAAQGKMVVMRRRRRGVAAVLFLVSAVASMAWWTWVF